MDHFDDEVILPKVLKKGSYLGEVGIIYQIKRTATARAMNYCTFGKVSNDFIHNLSIDLKLKLKNNTVNYKD